MDKLLILEKRIKTKLSRTRHYHGRRPDPWPEYRDGFCDGLEAVLKRIEKMK